MGSVTRILFVCAGNIVRSPLAAHLFRRMVDQAGVGDQYEVDSAGTDSYRVGEPPDPRMLQVAALHGERYEGRARQFRRPEFERFDWIVAMDRQNFDDLLSIVRTPEQEKKLHLLREFDSLGGPRQSVPDPCYGSADGFEEVYQVIERSVQGLLEHLQVSTGDL